jgi:serine/threonine protein kinase
MNYKFDMQSERWKAISNQGRHLIQSLMSFRHEDRLSAEDALKHDWFKLA